MLRFVLVLGLILPISFGQTFPAFRWIQELDNSGADTFAGIGADAQGNIYVAGSTLSPNFPVKSAVQSNLNSAGLYRIDGASYTRLGLGWVVSSLAGDPRNTSVFYAVSSGAGVKSVDGGNTWSALAMPSAQIQQFAVDPSNDQNVYAAAFDIGVLKSTDGGATWNPINNGLTPCSDCGLDPGILGARSIWIDPNTSAVFAYFGISLARSVDGGASWQTVGPSDNGFSLYFDAPNPGVLYWFTFHYGAFKSSDDGQTFQQVSIPVNSIFADPNQHGRLLGNGAGGIFESTDDGVTWTLRLPLAGAIVAADWANGFLYCSAAKGGILQVSSDLQTVAPVGPPGVAAAALVVSGGHVYVPNSGGHNAYVAKLDPSGNLLYATYFGGSGDDIAIAMAVDQTGGVYVTGMTTSQDFPATKGAYSSAAGSIFLFKLNPDGSVAYSTYFPAGMSTPAAISVDGAGAAYLTGSTNGGLPTTPGAYQTICGCAVESTGFLVFFETDAFLTKFDPAASTLVYSTYMGVANAAGRAIALGADGSAYIASGMGNATAVYRLNASGSSLLATGAPGVSIQAIAVAGDGSVYMAGSPQASEFQATAGAFQMTGPPPALPYQGSDAAAIVKMDSQLQKTLAATYFGGPYGPDVNALAIDAAGNIYIGGGTPPHGLPTRTPLVEAFGPPAGTGFLSEFSSDLSGLLFSTYLGDTDSFSVGGVALGQGGDVIVGGTTGGPKNVYVNSLLPAAPPALRIDNIENAASLVDGPLSAGETIVVNGAGFGSDAQLMIGGATVPTISTTATQIVAVVPSNLPNTPVLVQVQSGGAASNPVPVPVAAASPGVFSADGSGHGPGAIFNQDGTLNTPSNPAKPGDKITILATGVGPVSFTGGFAVTGFPVNVFIDGFYADGVAAVMGPIAGLPGSVYQITVFVPNFASLNPDLKNSTFPPLLGLMLEVAGNSSQIGLSVSIVGEGS